MGRSLEVNLGSLTLKNPFVVASCPATRSAEHIIDLARHGWAGAVTKTVTAHPPYNCNPRPFLSVYCVDQNKVGLFNNESYTVPTLERWCSYELPRVKREVSPDFVVVASVMEGVEASHWVDTALRLERAGADAIEMNVSCPHGMPERYMGSMIEDDPKLLANLVKACAKSISSPVIVKLNAMCSNLVEAAKACEIGGAEVISITNSLPAVPSFAVALSEREAEPRKWTYVGYSGPTIRPIALYMVSQLVQNTSLPVLGVGGIDSWKAALSFMLLGATAVQVATNVLFEGPNIVTNWLRQAEEFIGSSTLSSLRSLSLKSRVDVDRFCRECQGWVPTIVDKLCTRCAKCVLACEWASVGCLSLTSSGVRIDAEKCIGCGLCIAVCPQTAMV